MKYRCSSCKALKILSAFPRDSSKPHREYAGSKCKDCEKARRSSPEYLKKQEEYRRAKGIVPRGASSRELLTGDIKDYQQEYSLKRRYGMSKAEVLALLDKQDGLCAVCRKKVYLGGRAKDSLVVDHCHKKGHVRGVLCKACNTAIGFFGDSIVNLQNAIHYLS